MSKRKCILLLDTNEYLGRLAEDYCGALFEIMCVVRNQRNVKELSHEVFDTLNNNKIDYIFNFLSAVKVPVEVINSAKKFAINFHPAPPDYPGVGCASYALYDNAKEYGVTAHLMDETYDSGEILSVLKFPILNDDYCDTLFDRALQYTLMLFYNVLYELYTTGEINPCGAKWLRKPSTRKEFEKFMTILPTDQEEEVQRKIIATQHTKFSGPFIRIFGQHFEMPPRKK